MQYPIHRLAIAYAIDNGYTNQLKVVLYSLLKHKKINTAYDIYLLAYQFNPENLASLEQVLKEHDPQGSCSLTYLPISDADEQSIPLFKEVSFGHGWGKETIYRLLLPKYLPKLERVLYMDADILVQDDLSSVADISMRGKALLGVIDPVYVSLNNTLAMNTYRLARLEQLSDEEYQQLVLHKGQINAGILLMNLAYWRQEQLAQEMFSLLERIYTEGQEYIPLPQSPFIPPQTPVPYTILLCPDQDVINYVLARRNQEELGYLPTNYNIISFSFSRNQPFKPELWDAHKWLLYLQINSYVQERSLIDEQPKVWHFTSHLKPWNFQDHPFADLYVQYAQAVGWHITYTNTKKRKPTFVQRFIKMLLPYGLIRYIQISKKKRKNK